MIYAFFRRFLVIALLSGAASAVHAADVPVGAGGYSTHFKLESELPPVPAFKTANLKGPVPSNKWYSSVLYEQWSSSLYAQPVAYQARENGFEISQPRKTPRFNPVREETDIAYPHDPVLFVKPLGFGIKDARLDKASDWAADVVMGDGKDALKATIAHGDPFSYYQLTRGDAQITTKGNADIFYRSDDGQAIGIKAADQVYAVYFSKGTRWELASPDKLTLTLPDKARYFSVAALPGADAKIVDDFRRYAYAFITGTQAAWQYDETTSQVTTTFTVTTSVKEGEDNGKIFALFPHQWHNNPLLGKTLPYEYQTIRGTLKTVAGKSFQTRYTYPGILPAWPGLTDAEQVKRLNKYFDWEAGEGVVAGATGGTYWQGKGFGRAAQMLSIVEAQGDTQRRDQILKWMKVPIEKWFRLQPKPVSYFYYDKQNGTLIGFPTEYGASKQLNDHYFHYGYWIMAAAHIALRDPQWAAKNKWGGMIDLLVRDIAAGDRNDPMFARLRHFDPYEGHSWASGTAQFWDGNNQESSSEAINAWAGLILWGEATGNKALRDTGIYLYTTEIQAINNYWFDLHHQVFAPEYKNVEVSIVWGGKYEHRTWWTNEPREVHGINMLPITGASLYLGIDPEFVKRNIDAADKEFVLYREFDKNARADMWQDILLSYYALYDAPAALQKWDDSGGLENGETRSHTYYWIQSLANMGRPDFSVTADTPLYSVFKKGDQMTYLAYNATTKSKKVTFSNGVILEVAPKSLGSIQSGDKK